MTFPWAPHTPLMLPGGFNREMGEKSFCQPLAIKEKSGLDVKAWFFRSILTMEHLGITGGPLFRTTGSRSEGCKRASVGDVQPLFHGILKRVQIRCKEMTPEEVDIESECSVCRSLRRGATAEAQSSKILAHVMEANNRWRKHMRSKGMLPRMSVMERCADAKFECA